MESRKGFGSGGHFLPMVWRTETASVQAGTGMETQPLLTSEWCLGP